MTAGNKRFTAVVAILFLLALAGLTGCTEPKQAVGFPVAYAISGGAGGIAPAENMTVVPAAIWEKALARPDMMAYAANFRYYADRDLDDFYLNIIRSLKIIVPKYVVENGEYRINNEEK